MSIGRHIGLTSPSVHSHKHNATAIAMPQLLLSEIPSAFFYSFKVPVFTIIFVAIINSKNYEFIGYILMSCANGYVLFAANIDDFRSIAKKIVPGQLADQIAEMAARSMNLRHGSESRDYFDDIVNEKSKEDDDSSSEVYSDTAFTKPLLRKSRNILRTGNSAKYEGIDIDDLVKKVKEQLLKEYKYPTTTEAYTEPNFGVTELSVKKIDDYYYKDENLNPSNDEVYEEQGSTKNIDFTTGIPNYAFVPGYNGANENVEAKEVKYVEDEKAENSLRNMKQFVKQNVAKVKEIAEDNKEYEEVKAVPQDGGNVNEVLYMKDDNAKAPEYYEDDVKAQAPPAGNDDIFKEVDLLRNKDSYEDYVTPKRDDIFESDEPTKRPNVKAAGIQKFAAVNINYKNMPKAGNLLVKNGNPVINKEVNDPVKPTSEKKFYTGSTIPQEIKAKTESLWYKDPNIANYDDSTRPTTKGNKPKTKRFNTMFPTRTHIKMSTPNYYAKLPAVAEKYNFNEAIPEADREPEKIKYIGNPPALINKKVKL